MVVPVGNMKGDLVVSYSGDTGGYVHVIPSDAKFIHHNNFTAGTLHGFNASKHGLFAFNEAELVIYEYGDEARLFKRILQSSTAFLIDPFYRLSLALETEERSVIRPLYANCVKRLKRNTPDFLDQWVDAMAATSEVCKALSHEVPKGIKTPPLLAYPEERAAMTAERPRTTEIAAFMADVSPSMNASTIRSAVHKMTIQNARAYGIDNWPYSQAILASLGYSGSGEHATTSAPPPPTALDVVRVSGFSLSLLEFFNIILNKTTALEFLHLAQSGFKTNRLTRYVLRSEVYERTFNRRAPRLSRRQLYTFAEILSLVGYSGTVEPPLFN